MIWPPLWTGNFCQFLLIRDQGSMKQLSTKFGAFRWWGRFSPIWGFPVQRVVWPPLWTGNFCQFLLIRDQGPMKQLSTKFGAFRWWGLYRPYLPHLKGGLTTPLNRKFLSVLIDSRLGPHETTLHQILCILLMGSELMLSDQFRRPPLAACTRAGDLTKVILNQDTLRSQPICSNNLSLMGSLFRP